MAVKLRLRRTGKRNAPAHRLVAAEGSKARDGRFIETLGVYDPRSDVEDIKIDRVNYWLSQGAQPTATAARVIKRAQAKATQAGGSPSSEREASTTSATETSSNTAG